MRVVAWAFFVKCTGQDLVVAQPSSGLLMVVTLDGFELELALVILGEEDSRIFKEGPQAVILPGLGCPWMLK